MDLANGYSVALEAIRTFGIVVVAFVGIWTLKIAKDTKHLANSRLTEMIDKVDSLTGRLATSEERERHQRRRLDTHT